MKRTQILLNKPAHLGLSILEISKIVKYEFWYDYMKPIYRENSKLLHGYRKLYSLHTFE